MLSLNKISVTTWVIVCLQARSRGDESREEGPANRALRNLKRQASLLSWVCKSLSCKSLSFKHVKLISTITTTMTDTTGTLGRRCCREGTAVKAFTLRDSPDLRSIWSSAAQSAKWATESLAQQRQARLSPATVQVAAAAEQTLAVKDDEKWDHCTGQLGRWSVKHWELWSVFVIYSKRV